MKTNNYYIKPEIEVVEIQMEEGIMQASLNDGSSWELGGGEDVDRANSRRRGLWDE